MNHRTTDAQNAHPTAKPTTTPKRVTAMRIVAALAALTALVASGMLIAPHVVGSSFCAPGAGCDVVSKSAFSKILGVPVAFLGAFAYAIGLAAVTAPGHTSRKLAPGIGGVAIVAALTFLYLQKFVIGAWCIFCVVVDLSSIVFGLALIAEWLATRPHATPRHPFFPTPIAIAGVLAVSLPVFAATKRPPPPKPGALVEPVGRQGGKLVLREFVDLECPYCRATHQVLREKLKARPDIVIERHHVPLPRHQYARGAAIAACCASEQGAEERFIDAVVDQDVEPTASFCRGVAEKLGLDVSKFDACVSSDRPIKRIEASKALLDKTGFVGLPTVDLEEERSLGLLDDARADAFLGRHK